MKLVFNILFFIICCIFFSNKVSSTEKERFIVLGHLYPIVDNEITFNLLKEKINSYNPNYIFILGDSKIQNPKIYKKYIESFNNAELFFSPGNHELKDSSLDYITNVGYFNFFDEKKYFNLILINSSDNVENIKKNISEFLSQINNDKPTILFTHHRIWDDTLLSKKPFQHDKSFFFDEIYPLIKDEINYIFSGNSKRQYFKDFENFKTYGKQNVNNIFWLDKINQINAYSIGMGDGIPKANFTIVDVYKNNLVISGDYSSINDLHLLPRDKIIPDTSYLDQEYDKKKYFFINKKKLYLFLIIISFVLIFRKKFKFKR